MQLLLVGAAQLGKVTAHRLCSPAICADSCNVFKVASQRHPPTSRNCCMVLKDSSQCTLCQRSLLLLWGLWVLHSWVLENVQRVCRQHSRCVLAVWVSVLQCNYNAALTPPDCRNLLEFSTCVTSFLLGMLLRIPFIVMSCTQE